MTACAVGARGTILVSTDGVHWRQAGSGTRDDLNCVRFADRTHGWVLGYDTTGAPAIFATTDAGASWRSCPLGSYTDDCALSTLASTDARHVWAAGWSAGGMALVLASEDGGSSWTAQRPPVVFGQTIVTLAFADSEHGWALSADDKHFAGTILATTDGGRHWVRQKVLPHLDPTSLACADGLHCWVAGYCYYTRHDPQLWATEDGGRTWSPLTVSKEGVGQIVCFDSARLWLADLLGRTYRSGNGGRTWTRLAGTGFDQVDTVSVAFRDASHGLVVGYHFKQTSEGVMPDYTKPCLLATFDGGRSWVEQDLGTRQQLGDVDSVR
jgi:photosystem II stability/assembly factor-like uncharacterized protein